MGSVQASTGARLEPLKLNLREALRAVTRSPSLAAVVVLSLGVVIGANTAVFALVDAMLLRRLPLPRAEELVALRPVSQGRTVSLSYGQFSALRRLQDIPRVEAFRIEPATVTAGEQSSDLWVDMVTGGYLSLLGPVPILGRALQAADESTAAPVVVVSEDFWANYLGGDSAVVGRTIRVGGIAATIVGVLPRSFSGIHFARRLALLMPITVSPTGYEDLHALSVTLVARRSPSDAQAFGRFDLTVRRCCMGSAGANRSAAERVLSRSRPPDPPTANLSNLESENPAPHVTILDVSRGLTWSADHRLRYRRFLLALAAGAALLLLIACGNVAALLISRADARQRDFAIRLALGASRRTVAAQLILESLFLSVTGATLAIPIASAATEILARNLPSVAARLAETIAWRPSLAVFGFTTAIALGCTVLVGAWPARAGARADLLGPLTGWRAAPHSVRWAAGQGLVGAQLAFALVLVVLSALFVATVRQLTRLEGGYRTRQVLLARVIGQPNIGGDSAMAMRYQRIQLGAASLPGVSGAAFAWSAPVFQDALTQTSLGLPGGGGAGTEPITVRTNFIAPGYLAISGIGLAAGREFVTADDTTGERVVVLSEALNKHFFHGNVVGSMVQLSSGLVRVVGVARDARYDKLAGEPSLRNTEEEMVYIPMGQAALAGRRSFSSLTLVVRTTGDATQLAPALRRLVGDVAPDARLGAVTSVDQLLDNRAAPERFVAAMMSTFAILSLLLACAGVFGTMSYLVSRRAREIGVRMSLGATPADAVWLVLRRAALIAGLGSVAGTVLALAAGRVVRAQLFGISPSDPKVLVVAIATLVTAALLAALLPGIRAASVDPLIALRQE